MIATLDERAGMKRFFDGFLVMTLAALFAAFAGPSVGAEPQTWSYTGNTGPAKWAKLNKEFHLCGAGTMQSPLDIPDKEVRKGDLPALLFNYKPSPLRVVDDGHMIQLNYAPDSWVTVNGKRYELASIEFHKPAEVKVNGKGHEMEADLVHKAQDGKILVIAVPLDPGAENPIVKSVLANLPASKGAEQTVNAVTINALGLLPKEKDYYMYMGSLTAPPCTENVTWYVLRKPVTLSADQMARFARVYPMNARPTQPRNDRDIIGTP